MYLDVEQVDGRTRRHLGLLMKQDRKGYWKRKRLLDRILCVCLLAVSAPVWLLVMLALKLEDRDAKTVYSRVHLGRHGRPFRLYRFRASQSSALGRFLRTSSLDRIPHLVNVLKGEMSLVGPQPSVPAEVEAYSDYQRLRLLVTPGVTGIWQLSDKDSTREELDLEYIHCRNLWLDLRLILKTPLFLLRKVRQ